MTVRKSLIETHDTLILSLHADGVGDIFSLPQHASDYATLVGWGQATVTDHMAVPWDVDAPAIVYFAPGRVIFEARSEKLVVYCLFDKNAGPLQSVREFVNRP